MIFGIGIDVVEVPRVEDSLRRHGTRFIARIAHPAEKKGAPSEKSSAERRAQYWAARFAAKEAFAKALGTGIGRIVHWHSVGVAKNAAGAPRLEYSAELARHLKKLGIEQAHLALTHTAATAAAVVVLEGKLK
jgi:holo-[acyl-carrier protein] synthase